MNSGLSVPEGWLAFDLELEECLLRRILSETAVAQDGVRDAVQATADGLRQPGEGYFVPLPCPGDQFGIHGAPIAVGVRRADASTG